MKKLTKAQEKLLEQVKEYLESLDGDNRDEWWTTEKDLAKTFLSEFLRSIGISMD
jgi:hypothetical protein